MDSTGLGSAAIGFSGQSRPLNPIKQASFLSVEAFYLISVIKINHCFSCGVCF